MGTIDDVIENSAACTEDDYKYSEDDRSSSPDRNCDDVADFFGDTTEAPSTSSTNKPTSGDQLKVY